MAGKKDYFGIASRGFNHDARSGKREVTGSESLYDQLEKHGTPAEKQAIRKLKAEGKIGTKAQAQNSGFSINAWS